MSEWPTKPFRDIFKLKQGKYLTKEEMIDAPKGDWDIPVYGANGIIGYTNRAMYDRPVPLVSCRGANCGVTHLTQTRCWVSNNSIACIAEDADPRFFYHLFRITSFADVTGGSAQPQITLSSLGPKEVVCPPLEAQQRIALILGAYDDLIEVNRRRVAVLEEMARGLFEEWFVRFRFPGHEDVPIVDTPDGPLPEGWNLAPLGSVLRLHYGKALKAETRVPGDVSVIGSSGVVGSHTSRLVEGPGIVVGRKGNVGSVIWSTNDFWPIDTAYFVETALPLTFVYELLRRIPFENTDAAVPGLNRDYALSRLVVVPDADLIERYGRFAVPLRQQLDALQRTNDNLAASRDLLLPRLISGQLSVDAAERELENAA